MNRTSKNHHHMDDDNLTSMKESNCTIEPRGLVHTALHVTHATQAKSLSSINHHPVEKNQHLYIPRKSTMTQDSVASKKHNNNNNKKNGGGSGGGGSGRTTPVFNNLNTAAIDITPSTIEAATSTSTSMPFLTSPFRLRLDYLSHMTMNSQYQHKQPKPNLRRSATCLPAVKSYQDLRHLDDPINAPLGSKTSHGFVRFTSDAAPASNANVPSLKVKRYRSAPDCDTFLATNPSISLSKSTIDINTAPQHVHTSTRILRHQPTVELTTQQVAQLAYHQRTFNLTKINAIANRDGQRTWAALCFTMMTLYFVFGISFFRLRYNWPVQDSLLFTVYTFTTIGYGNHDINPGEDTLTYAFLTVFAISGIGIWAVVLLQMQNFITTEIQRRDGRKVASAVQRTGDITLSDNGNVLRRLSGSQHSSIVVTHHPHYSDDDDDDDVEVVQRLDTGTTTTTTFNHPHNNDRPDSYDHYNQKHHRCCYKHYAHLINILITLKSKAWYYTRHSLLTRICTVLLPFTVLLLPAAVILSFIEPDWTLLESFYFSVITLTTVGFGDLYPTNTASIWFCIFYLPFSTGFMSFFITEVVVFYVQHIDRPNVLRIMKGMQRKTDMVEQQHEGEGLEYDAEQPAMAMPRQREHEHDHEQPMSTSDSTDQNMSHSPPSSKSSDSSSSPKPCQITASRQTSSSTTMLEFLHRTLHQTGTAHPKSNLLGPFLFLDLQDKTGIGSISQSFHGKPPSITAEQRRLVIVQVEHRLAYIICHDLFCKKYLEVKIEVDDLANHDELKNVTAANANVNTSTATNANIKGNMNKNVLDLIHGHGSAGSTSEDMYPQNPSDNMNDIGANLSSSSAQFNPTVAMSEVTAIEEYTDINNSNNISSADNHTNQRQLQLYLGNWKQMAQRWIVPHRCKNGLRMVCMRLLYRLGTNFAEGYEEDEKQSMCMEHLLKLSIKDYRALIAPFMIPMAEDVKQMELWLAATSLIVFRSSPKQQKKLSRKSIPKDNATISSQPAPLKTFVHAPVKKIRPVAGNQDASRRFRQSELVRDEKRSSYNVKQISCLSDPGDALF